MGPQQIVDFVNSLSLQAGLALALVALLTGFVRSGRSEDKRFAEMSAERDKREALLVAERDQWKSIAEKQEVRADQADDRAVLLTQAFDKALKS